MLYNFKWWQNGKIGIFYCLHPYPSITSILTILHGWDGVQHKSSNTPLEKKKKEKLGILKRIRCTVSLDLHDLYPKAPQVNGKSLVSASDFSRRGRWGQVNKYVCQRGSLVYWVPPPPKNIEERYISKAQEPAARAAARVMRDSIEEMVLQATWNVPHHHIHLLHSQLPV